MIADCHRVHIGRTQLASDRWQLISATLVFAIAAFLVVSSTASAAPAGTGIEFRTIPPIAGVPIKLADNQVLVTRKDGKFNVPLSAILPEFRQRIQSGSLRDGVPIRAKVGEVRLKDGGIARFKRFFGNTIALGTYYRVKPKFVTVHGDPVDASRVQQYTLRSRSGVVIDAKGTESLELERSRVVRLGSGLLSKPIEWTVDEVKVNGANVVNRSQQQFDPRALDGTLEIGVLFFSARISSIDAIFKWPTGSEVILTHPNGHVSRHPLGSGGSLTLDNLPRGDYQVTVEGPGMAPERPVALSRNQEVELKVISYLDMIAVFIFMLGLAITLLLLRRPNLRGPVAKVYKRLREESTTNVRVGER